MKYTILVAFLALALAPAPALAQVSSYPYIQDFETTNDWVSSGVGDSWAFGTPAKPVINSAASGVNCWVTGGLAGTYSPSEQSQILGPVFDFTGQISAAISLSIWWEAENSWDGLVLQSSIDGGMTWQNVGAFGDPDPNWYNDNTINGTPGGSMEGWTGTGSSWLTATHALTGLAGQPSVMLRFAFGSDPSVNFEGVAVDDILITAVPAIPADTGVVSIDSPVGTIAAAIYPVTVTIQNFGTAPQSNIPVDLVVDMGAPVTETYVPMIAPGTSASYTFTATADLSAGGPHTLSAYTTLPGDANPGNDGTMSTVQSVALVSTFPYFEDFEGGMGPWVSGGTNDSWAFGTPAKPVINSAASGVNCWVNGGLAGQYPNNEQSFITGPIFDLSSLTNPFIAFNIWWETEFSWDGLVLQSSIDGGMTWQNVGLFGDPGNWYTDNTINGTPGGSMEGWTGRTTSGNGSGMWLPAANFLTGLGGQPSVQLRFAFGSDASVQWEGVAIDDIQVAEANIPYPGTPMGDLVLGTGVNAAPSSGLNQYVKTATGLDAINLLVSSPAGTYDFQPYVLLTQVFTTGSPPTPSFPGLGVWLDLTQPFVILVDIDPFLSQVLEPGGTGYGFIMPLGFGGQSFIFQAAGVVPALSLTDGYQVDVM